MPTIIPKRQPQVAAPSAKGIRYPADQQVSNSMKLLGNAVLRHTERIQGQHDIATSQAVFRNLRDMARLELDGHLAKEGADAMNSISSYSKWFDENAGKAEFGLQNETQRKLFRSSADTIRGRDLDTLSKHQAKQHRLRLIRGIKEQSLMGDGEVVRSPTGQTRAEELGKTKALLRPLYPSETDEQLEERLDPDKKRYSVIILKEMLKEDPENAMLHVELWKEDLGDIYDDTQKWVYREGLFQVAQQRFPINLETNEGFDEQFDFVKNFPGVTSDIKQSVQSRINTLESESKARATALETKRNEAHDEEVVGLIREGKYEKAWTANDEAEHIDGKRKYRWEGVIKSATKIATVDDGEDKLRVLTNYMEMTPAEILNEKNLTPETKEHFLDKREKAVKAGQKPYTERRKEARKSVSAQLIKGNIFGVKDPGSVEDAYAAVDALDDALDEAKTVSEKMDLLDPNSPKYIIPKIIKDKSLSPVDQSRRMTRRYLTEESPDTQRKPNETTEDYLRRVTD